MSEPVILEDGRVVVNPCPCCRWAVERGYGGEIQSATNGARRPGNLFDGDPDGEPVCLGCAEWIDFGGDQGFGSEPIGVSE